MKLRTLIVDDEKPARKKIRHFLEGDPDIEIIGEGDNGPAALKCIEMHAPELIFLDIQMPGLDGFGLLKRAYRERSFAVVFVTAYDEYAVKAFDVNAVDYLLKPFTRRRFEEALRKVKQQFLQVEPTSAADRTLQLLETLHHKEPYVLRLPVKSERGIIFVRTDQIDWIETKDNYLLIHSGKQSHLIRESMNSIEHSLDPEKFLRIHRRILVNIDAIHEMNPYRNSCLILHDGSVLPVSRRMKEGVKRFLLNRHV